MLYKALTTLCTILVLLASTARTQSYTGPEDPRLNVELVLETPCNGVSLTTSRLFLAYARIDGSTGPQVVQYNQTTNVSTPYPNARWNSYKQGDNPATHFVGVNAQRIGPDGQLWIVDKGATAIGEPVDLPYGPKVVVVNVNTNNVSRVYPMGNVTTERSFLDDIRFNPAAGKAYLTDAGDPGLIVLDLDSGVAVRVLSHALATREYMPVSAEGSILMMDGNPFYFYADQHEVSPDGQYYYFQPSSGGMSRIPTQYMDEAFSNSTFDKNKIVKQYVEPYAHTPSTGGTAIDAQGNIYNSDTDSQRIIKILPNGTMTTLVQDPRLLWVDAMWVDDQQRLWMPADQLNRGTPFHNGTSEIVKPFYVFTMDIGVGPSPIDHS